MSDPTWPPPFQDAPPADDGRPAATAGWAAGPAAAGPVDDSGDAWSEGWTGLSSLDPPGIVPLRPLLFGEVLDGAVQLVRAAPRLVLGLSFGAAVLGQLVTVLIDLGALRRSFSDSLGGGAGGLELSGSFVVSLLLAALVQLVLAGMLTVVAAELVVGRRPTLAGTWARVRPVLPALVIGATLATVLPFLGLPLLVVPGVFLWAALALTTPALVLERLGPVAALRRSVRLVRPDFWRVLGIRLVTWLLVQTIANVLVLPAVAVVGGVTAFGQIDTDTGAVLLVVVVLVIGVVATAITAPFSAGVDALLYIDRRMRSEGLDIRLRDAADEARRERSSSGAGG